MRVLYITEIYPDVTRGFGVWGGGEKQFYEISKRVAYRGHEVSILTCRFPSQPAIEVIGNIKIYRLGLSRNPATGGARRSIFRARDFFLHYWNSCESFQVGTKCDSL